MLIQQVSWRRVPALIAALFGLALVFIAGANPAAAHAVVVEITPEPDSVLSEEITEVRITFNEPVAVTDEGMLVLDDEGNEVAGRAESQNSDAVFIADAPLETGTHLVSWRVVSDDGHPITGAFTFSVNEKTQAPEITDDSAFNPIEPAVWGAQALIYLGLLLFAGLILFDVWCVPSATFFGGVRGRLLTWRNRAAALAAVGLFIYVPVFTLWQKGGGWAQIMDGAVWASAVTSDAAWATGAGIVGLALGLWAHRAWAGRRAAMRPRVVFSVLLGTGLVLALGSQLVIGHTRTIDPMWLVMASDIVHLFVAAFWIGGIFGLIVAFRKLDLPETTGQIVTRFSKAAIWVVGALAVTGVVLGWRILGGFGPLFTTRYGLLLIAKVALILIVIAFAAWNHLRLVPAINAESASDQVGALGRLRRSVAIEAVLIAAAVAVTGVLVSQSPQDAAGPYEFTENYELSEADLELEIKEMGYLGRHFEFELTGDSGPFEPESVPELTMFMPDKNIGPLAVQVNEQSPGDYGAHFDAPLAGKWKAQLNVRTSKYSQEKIEVELHID